MSEEIDIENLDFIRKIIKDDLANNRNEGRLVTRFPPEPNGFLHIGHAKAICLDFGVISEFKDKSSDSKCHLRMDDTNPTKEEDFYVKSIEEDVFWLGFSWCENMFFASDYFDKIYEFAVEMIEKGLAYVDNQNADEISKTRGTLTEPGIESKYRNRSIEENLDLFNRMKEGQFSEGECVLRAKIDMASKNINLRDPIIYRILKQSHHRTGKKWCIYPMYDFAHPLSDAIEGITHSFCTLEFEHHRPLYDFFIENTSAINLFGKSRPRQFEFSRLRISNTILSKRKLGNLVEKKMVSGWDDPRLPTISGIRRRGFTAKAIRSFCKNIGITKYNSLTDIGTLENIQRSELNKECDRYMVVIKPLKIVIENFPEGEVVWLDAKNNPEDDSKGSRKVPFTRNLFIEADDFMENAPKKFFRLSQEREVRFRYAYFIKCIGVIKDENTGEVVELRCTYDPETKGGKSNDGRKVKSTIHWVSADFGKKIYANLYDRLFTCDDPEMMGDEYLDHYNSESYVQKNDCVAEPELLNAAKPESRFQFERVGYFYVDPVSNKESNRGESLVFNKIVSLREARKLKEIKSK